MDEPRPQDEFLSRYKYPLIISLVGLVLLVGGLISSGILPRIFLKSSRVSYQQQATLSKLVKVDISGAVAIPGVYELPVDSRIEEVIKIAGGFDPGVNQEYVSKSLNLAQKISDGMKIYIPFQGDAGSAPISSGSGWGKAVLGSINGKVVNVNSSSMEELDSLPGVGPVTAQKIIDSRPYQSIEELLSKKAVTRSVFEKIRDKISI